LLRMGWISSRSLLMSVHLSIVWNKKLWIRS
jgi:hypothetical protein